MSTRQKFPILTLFSILLIPSVGFAQMLSGEMGQVSTNLKYVGEVNHPEWNYVGSADLNTGLGRHDAIIRWAAGEDYFMIEDGDAYNQSVKKYFFTHERFFKA